MAVPLAMTREQRTPLFIEAQNGRVDNVKSLLREDGVVDGIEEKAMYNECTAFSIASANGHYAVVCLLYEASADINTRDALGWQPIHWAALKGYYHVVQFLIDVGADTTVTICWRDPVMRDFGGNGVLPISHPEQTLQQHVNTRNIHTWEAMAQRWHPTLMPRIEAKADLRDKCVAFAMGNQSRLGEESRVLQLDKELARIIVLFALDLCHE
jgi:hypothetical protein